MTVDDRSRPVHLDRVVKGKVDCPVHLDNPDLEDSASECANDHN